MRVFHNFFVGISALAAILIAVCGVGFIAANSAAAQNGSSQPEPTEALLTFFYKDPRPERLVGFFEGLESSPASQNWEAYPPMVGFFAVIFSKHPDQIERLLPTRFNPRSAVTIEAALHLSSNASVAANLQSKFDQAGADEKLKAELADLPSSLEEVRVQTPSHLDIMWGAAFASGDERFVSVIADFFAQTANRSEDVAIDVMKMVNAMTGGPKEILTQLRGKYGDVLAREILFAATALWALRSNAASHPFVNHLVAKYAEDHIGTPVAQALSTLSPRRK